MNINKYLERILYSDSLKVNVETLYALHRKQLNHIPFENFNIVNKKKVILDLKHLENKIINNRRGGFCYELNALFYELLKQIGFDVKMIAARVYNLAGDLGQEYDHMALIVQLDKTYLVDVGFGASFHEPLLLELETIQKDVNHYFKIAEYDEGYLCLYWSEDGVNFTKKYLFTLKERKLSDFESMCNYHQSSPESIFTQKMICTKTTKNGRITLSDHKLITTIGNTKHEKLIMDEDELNKILEEKFDITLST
ncbi:MAG: arylamine N-acetyltransferase [Bacteroidetes bacterium]|nr:MAG: arylamine N-acetyltransferase [Bacteroidota bacterium]